MSDLSQRLSQLTPEKRALLEKRLQEKNAEARSAGSEPIAIIGMSCRFPGGANSPEAFWQLLKNGVDAITEVPAERWEANAFYDPDPMRPGKMNTRWGGFLRDLDKFDREFFGLSAREAAEMDPQQRMLLETAWEALEAAGQNMEQLKGSASGVFIGIHSFSSDYSWMQLHDNDNIGTYTSTGTTHSIMANRISYLFDLRGPSLSVDTACSSSLVAVHLACQSLRARESHLALVGGANLFLTPATTLSFAKLRMMSSHGRCKTFDASGDGFVRGEGCGMVALKRYTDARANGDPILALIRGTATNQDGFTNGLTAPNGLAQQQVIRRALHDAGIAPHLVSYVETHGTGTALGDPIEVEALKEVLGQPRPHGPACVISSVKTNLGHLEGAAGIAGLIKVVLCLQHGEIPPHLHLTELNPHLQLENTPFVIPTQGCPWPSGVEQRIAGLSSFGFGGTNAHVVVSDQSSVISHQSSVQTDHRSLDTDHWSLNTDHCHLLPLSAKNPAALRELVMAYESYLKSSREVSPHDLTYTASLRRTHHDYRVALAFRSMEDLLARMNELLRGEAQPSLREVRKVAEQLPGLAFVFSGQGPQWFAMGRQLVQESPVFRAKIEECDALLRAHASWSLLEELQREEAASRMDQTEIAQPAIFALQVALAKVWRTWGIVPEAVIGHSMGEVAAAHVAGALSLAEAVRVIFHRARLMQRATGQGKMAQVELEVEAVRQALLPYRDRLAVAASNSPSSTVIAGEETALEEVLRSFEARQIEVKRLRVNYAFHSPRMEPHRLELEHALRGLAPRATTTPMISTVTGKLIRGEELHAAYWGRNLREPVAFAPAIASLLQDHFAAFVELSPHPVLAAAMAKCAEVHQSEVTVLASLRRGQDEAATMVKALGALYSRGYAIDWKALHPNGGRCIALPSYPWQRQSYWIANERKTKSGARHHSAHDSRSTINDPQSTPLLGARMHTPQPSFQSQWRGATLPFIEPERREGEAVFPAAALVEMALAAAHESLGTNEYELHDVRLHETVVLPDESETVLHLQLRPEDETFELFSSAAETPHDWALRASGKFRAIENVSENAVVSNIPSLRGVRGVSSEAHTISETSNANITPPCPPQGGNIQDEETLAAIKSRCAEELAREDFEARLTQLALQFGAGARGLSKVYRGVSEALAEVQLPAETTHVRVALLDNLLQLLPALLPEEPITSSEKVYNVTQVQRVHWHGAATTSAWAHAILREREDAKRMRADFYLYDADGNLLLETLGVVVECAPRPQPQNIPHRMLANWLYEVQWQAQARRDTNATSQPGHWLILSDRAGFGEALANLLTSKGHTCEVLFAEASTALEQQRLQQALAASATARALQGLIHLWSLNLTPNVAQASLPADPSMGCASLLLALQALLARKDQTRLWIITQNAQAANAEPISLNGSALWGMGRTLALEHPEVWGAQIDLGAHTPPHAAELIAQELLHNDGEDQIAFRAEHRFVARLQRPQLARSTPVSLRADRTYLITGGLGSLGLHAAMWLAEHGARHIALLSRRKFPARAEWPELEQHAPWRETLATIKQLEDAGVHWQVYSAEVGDATRMAEVFTEVHAALPPLAGVIHAAGVSSRKALRALSVEDLRETFRAKVQGAWVLHELTQALPLDFFVLYSSISAVWGAKDLGHYAAANHFLDLLAHHRRNLQLPALSVNWGPWAGGGMAGEEFVATLERTGLSALQPHEALAALGLLLGNAATQIIVAKVQWPRFKDMLELKSPRPLLADWAGHERASHPSDARAEELRRQLEQADPVKRRELLTQHIQQEAAKTLGLPVTYALEAAQGFFNMGMDSVMALELKTRLEKLLDVNLPRTVAFEHPSIIKLATHLGEKFFSPAPLVMEATHVAGNHEAQAAALTEIQNLSEEELAAIVDAELAQLGR